MTTYREDLTRGLSNAAWGYFFLNFDFNLGTVSIFPRFVGFLLFLSAIRKLSGERRDLALLRPLCVLLAAWHTVDWLLSWGGGSADGHILFLDLLVAVAGLYFHFQFLTDMAALAEEYQPEGGDLDARIRRRRTVYIVLITVISLASSLDLQRLVTGSDIILGVLTVMTIVALITALLILAALFELRRCLQVEPGEDDLDM